MNKQMSLSAFDDELAQVRTKKKEFLAKIDRIIPWGEWLTLIRPHYYKGERGNKPYDLELMLRIYLLQNLYDLSDEGCVAEVIDSRAFSDFCGVDSSNQIPNGDTRRYTRKISQSADRKRTAGKAVYTSSQNADGKGLDSQKGNDRRFNHHSCAFFH